MIRNELNADALKEAISVINTGESRKVVFDFQAVRFFHNFECRRPYGPSTVIAITIGDVASFPLISSIVSIFSGRLGITVK